MSSLACGPFSQTLFLGASITSFSADLGWNSDQGTLTVELVEDPCRGTKVYYESAFYTKTTNQPDFFNPPKMGSPVFFKFGDFTFGGILENWEEQVDAKGGKTYTVKCIDGVTLLENCQVIINNYTGSTFGVPNLINAFGYTEELASNCNTLAYTGSLNPPLAYQPATGFGGANIAEDGMSWFQIRDALQTLTVFPNNYGGQIQLRDQRYYIDITELPTMDANFRFNGDSLTILECVSQLCTATGMDFFIEILYFTPNSVPAGYGGITGLIHDNVIKVIKVRTTSRRVQKTSAYNIDFTVNSPIGARLSFGTLTSYVGDGTGRARSSRGLELRSDTTNAFLVGDNRQDLWQQAYTGSANTYTDTIWPFWGKDENNFPIISNGINNAHTFTVSTVGFGPDLINVLGATYTMNFLELRVALVGMEEWAYYMEVEKNGISVALEIDSAFTQDVAEVLADADIPPKAGDMHKSKVEAARIAAIHAGLVDAGIDFAELQKRLFEIVKSYAELAGKKFMVAIPLICSAADNSAPFSIKLNWEPSDGAWTDANVQLHPSADSLPPASPILEFFRVENDGRLGCFVYFNTGDEDALIDYSQLSPDDVIPISENACYVKGTVEEIIFLNPVARTYPRAIVSINNAVTIKGIEGELDAPFVDNLNGAIGDVDPDWLALRKGNAIGDDTSKMPLSSLPIIPLGAAVPLRSTNLSYGPWFTTLSFGPASKTIYERDTSISPWSFGNTNVMNYAGQIKVESEVTEQVVSEAGSFTIAGAPPGRLGQILIAGGPEVTKVNVEVSTGGITSSIQLRTFVPNFGEMGRRTIQNLRTAGTYQQKFQRAFLNKAITAFTKNAFSNLTRPFEKTDRFDRHSSHTIIAGEYIAGYTVSGSGNATISTTNKRTNVVLTDIRKVLPELYNNYDEKAFMELGGLFRPFETVSNPSHNFPAFLNISQGLTTITDISLNPFKTSEALFGTSIGHDIEYISRGNSIGSITDLSIKKEGSHGSGPFRGLGLRAPLVLVGWGFDINGKPVPNNTPSSPGNSFLTDYLQRPNTWKAGPLDVRWDESRGVWAANSDSRLFRAVSTTDIRPGSSGLVTIVGVAGSIMFTDEIYRNCILTNEVVHVIINNNIARPFAENGLTRRAKTVNMISTGSSGVCNFTGTAFQEYVYADWMMGTSGGISGNIEAIVEYLPSERKWRFVSAACDITP